MLKLESSVYVAIKASKAKSLLVAVSGGADSVALLVACSRLSHRFSLRIEAVNCNFHLRGEESDRDSAFTAQLCQTLGVKLHTLDYDVKAYLRQITSTSVEMACRELRYADFFRIMQEEGLDRVAVAHNSDDDIETMLLNMLRGSGTRGLKGMDRDNGRVIRPLLDISRKEIEEYLQTLEMEYQIDSSNLSNAYRRNFIRNNVLSIFESRWKGARKALSRTVGILKEESEILEDFYRKQLETMSPKKDILLIYSDGIKTGTVLRFLEPYGGNSEIAEEIMEARNHIFKKRTWNLSKRYKAYFERDHLVIADLSKEITPGKISWTRMEMNPDTMQEVRLNKSHNIAYLPSDESAYNLRPPKIGDRMSPLGMRGSRLVSDIISDARLHRWEMNMVRVLERKSDGEIIWIPGLKRSRHDLISPDSPRCFRAELHLPDEPSPIL